MSEYSAMIGTTLQKFSVESLVDITIGWMEGRQITTNLPHKLPGLNEESFDHTIQCIIRFVAAHVFYPRASTPFALINVSMGLAHGGIGLFLWFKTKEKIEDAPEKWQEIALHCHKGSAHLITAAYDFGIGYFLSQQPYGLAGVAAFVLAPSTVAMWHGRVFAKPIHQNTLPTEDTSTEKAKPSYLSPECYTYKLAEKITLFLIPFKSSSPTTEPASKPD